MKLVNYVVFILVIISCTPTSKKKVAGNEIIDSNLSFDTLRITYSNSSSKRIDSLAFLDGYHLVNKVEINRIVNCLNTSEVKALKFIPQFVITLKGDTTLKVGYYPPSLIKENGRTYVLGCVLLDKIIETVACPQ